MEKVFNKTITSSKIHEAVLYVESSSGHVSKDFGFGGRTIHSPMVAASITKLFTTTCILKLYEQGKLTLQDKLDRYFDSEQLKGLHVLKGRDYTFDLTLSHLLFQTSGLPDDFESSKKSNTLKSYLEKDFRFTFEETLENTKKLKPHFPPNSKRAYYSNINFDLLGEIIKKVIQKPLATVYRESIFEPLKMKQTYLPTDEKDFVPAVFFKGEKLIRPNLIISSGASGGCVTSPNDLMIFSKSFWKGKLFDETLLKELSVYRKLQFSKGPISYGGGFMKINAGGFMTMFVGKGELLGHSGSTGSFAFYYPFKDLHFVGDLNQMANPALPIRLLLKMVMAAKHL